MSSNFRDIALDLIDIGKKSKNIDMERVGLGLLGENVVRDYLKTTTYRHMQLDLVYWPHGEGNFYRVAEIKCQERFLAPPFDGHGLPLHQFNERLKLEKSMRNMRPGREHQSVQVWLFIIEPSTWLNEAITEKVIFSQSIARLNALPDEKKFVSHQSKRIIFPIEEFEKIIVTP